MILGKFSKYVPSDEMRIFDAEVIKKITGYGVIFLRDDKGLDWYDAQKILSPNTMKVVFGDDNVVRSFSTEASMLNPIDMSVGEIEISDVPEDMDVLGGWLFDGVKVVKREQSKDELVARAEEKKQMLLKTATAEIAPLQDAVELELATKEEELLLTEWKKYRIEVNRIDTSLPNDINWPSLPYALNRR